MRARILAIAVAALLPLAARAIRLDRVQETLGPYRLGTPYDELKALSGFKLDEKRTEPAKEIVAGKIIDKRIDGRTPSIQRLIFKRGKLYRISIIFHPPSDWTEERVKEWLIPQWGDPGAKELIDKELHYVWHFKNALGMILPADGGRFMASIMVDD